MSAQSSFSRMFVLISLGIGAILMLALVIANISHTPLHGSPETAATEENGESASPALPEFKLSEEQTAEIGELMAKLKDAPNDSETLLALGNAFLRAKDWARAEVFLSRAVLGKPGDIMPRYMLGMAQHQLGKLPEAVGTFEELLTLKEDPDVMYNLGVIYKYQMLNRQKADELFARVLKSPEASAQTKEKAAQEMR